MKKTKTEQAQAKLDDLMHEDEVVATFRLSKPQLRKMRGNGEIKHFRYLLPASTGNPDRPGKKPVYSRTELAEKYGFPSAS